MAAALTVSRRFWPTYGTDPLPSAEEALALPLKAFPGWFLCVQCERCGETRMMNEVHTAWRDVRLSAILARMRHERCGGRAAKAELLTGAEGASSRPVRRIALKPPPGNGRD